MNIRQLKDLIEDLPDDMPIVLRTQLTHPEVRSLLGIHIRPYDVKKNQVVDIEEGITAFPDAFVLNPSIRKSS